MTPLLDIDGLSVLYPGRGGDVLAVRDVSLRLMKGEAVGLVGESGCGKSTLAGAILAAVPGRGRIAAGAIRFDGADIATLSPAALRQMRGGGIGLVSQDAMSALNPAFRIGDQLIETLLCHRPVGRAAARHAALAMLDEVGLPDPARIMDAYPHRLSGGQQQRVVIAMALLPQPRLLLLDEPTTALDVTVEAGIIDLLRRLCAAHGTALLFITHNLGLVAQLCRRVAVMYAGQVVETGPVGAVFDAPRHPYARGLIACIPRPDLPRSQQPIASALGQSAGGLPDAGCAFAPRCPHAAPQCAAAIPLLPAGDGAVRCVRWQDLPQDEAPAPAPQAPLAPPRPLLAVENLSKTYRLARTLEIRANDGLNFAVGHGRTLAIVGESGCGKTTFARTLMGLEDATAGAIRFDGADIARMPVARRPAALLRALQMVFQNPDETLNPSYSVGRQVARAVKLLDRGGGPIAQRVAALFAATRLPTALADRLPRQLSGGQKQRVGIARAFAGQPALVVADEPVSALDVSVQAAVTRLLLDMQAEHGTALVVISHDLGFVRAVADEVVVMYLGRVVEAGPAAAVFAPPYHPYTEALLSAVPAARAAGRRVVLQGDLPSALRPPAGCAFHTRCPRRIGAVCDTDPPPEQVSADGHRILCHIPVVELALIPPVFPQQSSRNSP
jgi:peptide/nickel transport system ATP-binding protein